MSRPPLHLWGVDGALAPLPGGHRNTVFRLRRDQGDLVFKSTRRDAAALLWLGAVFDQIEAAQIIVPRLQPSLSGALVEDGWTCEPFVAGPKASDKRVSMLRLPGFITTQRPGFTTAAELCDQTRSGDIDLTLMPPALVTSCRDAWQCLADLPTGVVHGDLGPGNTIKCDDGRLCLLDWDEARVDALIFDAPLCALSEPHQRARMAWEIAACWQIEPDRARQLAAVFTA